MVKGLLLLVVILAVVYLRLVRRGERACPRCGRANPGHRNFCRACSAPLGRRQEGV